MDKNDMILDKIVSFCNSSELRKKLLQQDDLDLDKALKIARNLEVAAHQTKEIDSNLQSKSEKL